MLFPYCVLLSEKNHLDIGHCNGLSVWILRKIFGLIDITLCSIEYICPKRPLANAGLVIITNYYSISLPFTSLKLGMGFYSRICLQMLTSNAANYFCTRRNALLFSQACNYHAELKYEWDLQWISHNAFPRALMSYCLKCPSDCKTRSVKIFQIVLSSEYQTLLFKISILIVVYQMLTKWKSRSSINTFSRIKIFYCLYLPYS